MSMRIDSLPQAALHESPCAEETKNFPRSSLYTDASIEKAAQQIKTAYEPTKPSLPRPSGAVEYHVLNSLDKLHVAGSSWLDLQSSMLDECNEKLNEVQRRNIQKLNEAAKHAESSALWSFIKKAGAFILAAVSTVFGFSLIASGAGTLVGAAMVASGLLTITNVAFTETGVWDWVAHKLAGENEKLRKRLETIFPCAVGVTAAIVGLAGSAAVLAWTSLSLVEKGLVIVQTALNLAEGTITIIEGVNEFHSLRARADLYEIKKDLFVNQNKLEKTTGSMEKFMKLISHASSEAAKAIKLSVSSNQRIILQG